MSFTSKFNVFFDLNYFAKSSLYQYIVPSQPMYDKALLAQKRSFHSYKSLVFVDYFAKKECLSK